MRIVHLTLSLALVASLAGCARYTWDKPGATSADFSRMKAQCSLFSRHASSSEFVAVGDPKFVGAAALGHGLGKAVSRQADFNDCMAANGWIAREGK